MGNKNRFLSHVSKIHTPHHGSTVQRTFLVIDFWLSGIQSTVAFTYGLGRYSILKLGAQEGTFKGHLGPTPLPWARTLSTRPSC